MKKNHNHSHPAQPDKKPEWQLYNSHAEQTWKDLQTSSDDFDKNLLKFSSAALALSLTVIKQLVPLKEAVFKVYLYASWIAFGACIVTTIFSFPLSVQAQKRHLKNLYEYYINRNDEYLNGTNPWTIAVAVFGWISGVFFLAGIIATVVFAIENARRIH